MAIELSAETYVGTDHQGTPLYIGDTVRIVWSPTASLDRLQYAFGTVERSNLNVSGELVPWTTLGTTNTRRIR